jgi:hypothetical protein
MTDLTDKWKKGELPEGYYYVKDGENIIAEYLDGYFYNNGQPMTSFSGGVDKVLEPVPSHEEYDNVIKCYLCAHEKADRFEKENQKLKALLKEVGGKLKYINTPRNKHNIFGNDLMKKINQALGEDK